MMVPKKSLFLAGAALLCLSVGTSAQQMKRVTGPLRSVTLDSQTGTLTRGPMVDEKGAFTYNTVRVLTNLDLTGFAGLDTGPGANHGPCEWFVAMPNYGSGAPDRTGGESQFLTALRFIYCSSALDTRSGGPGGTAIITFREGYTLGTFANSAGPTGTQVAHFTLTALPANTTFGPNGGARCYFFTYHTPTTVIHDGRLGYSWEFADLDFQMQDGATFPWLACVQSCTGPGPDRSGGMVDYIDQYCPKGGAPLTSFTFGTFGGTSNYFTSISMIIREAERIDSASTFYNGTGVNTAALTATGAGVILGQTWGLSADCTGGGAVGKFTIFALSFAPSVHVSTKYGERLVVVAPGAFVSFTVPQPGSLISNLGPFPLPLDLTFYNSCWTAQALCGGTSIGFLTTGLQQTLGSH